MRGRRRCHAWIGLVAAASACVVTISVIGEGEALSAGAPSRIVYAVVGECDDQEPDCAGTWLESARVTGPPAREVLTCQEAGCLATDPDVSPADGRIAYAGGGIYISSGEGSQPRLLVREGNDPSWAPNGGRIVFGRVNGRGGANVLDDYALYMKRLGDTPANRLTKGLGPDWSSQGQIAFARVDRRFRLDVYVIGPDGQGLRRVTRGGRSSAPSWAPDGRRLAIERRVGAKTNIVVIDRRGRTLRVLTRKGGRTPAWSRDGKQIAFYRADPEFQGNGSVHVVGASGGGLRRVTRGVGYPAGIDWATGR